VRARAFVDASGEGDLAFFAGASTRYGNDGLVNLGTLGTRFGGIGKDVVVTADQLAQAVARGAGPFTKDRSVLVRLPVSGDRVCYVASADYDPRDARSFSDAERRAASRPGPISRRSARFQVRGAYLVSTGPNSARANRGTSMPSINSPGRTSWRPRDRRRHRSRRLGRRMARPQDLREHVRLSARQGNLSDPAALPREPRHANLFAAGRLADADQKAGASLRVMGTAFATGRPPASPPRWSPNAAAQADDARMCAGRERDDRI
jgi:hypothetical protein